MSTLPVSTEWLLLALRAAFVVLLYVVIFAVARTSLRDLIAVAVPRRNGVAADRLTLIDGAESGIPTGTWFPLAEGAVVGRSPGSTVRIDDGFVSGRHALIERDGGDWVVTDLGSTNGTLVNGRPVGSGAVIRRGDIVQFGRVTLQLTAAPSEQGDVRAR